MKISALEAARAFPNFQSDLSRDRPFTLIAGAPLGSLTLTYRFDDNNETITVPNLWRNQTAASQISQMRDLANLLDRQAKGLEAVPMLHRSAEENATRANYYRRRAEMYRLMADRQQMLTEQDLHGSFQELETFVVEAA